jgi:hypothetical protein
MSAATFPAWFRELWKIAEKHTPDGKFLALGGDSDAWDQANAEGLLDSAGGMLQYVLDKMGKDVVLMALGGGSAVLTEADNGKLYFIQADAQTVTLPDSPPVGWKVAVGIGNLSITGAVVTQGTNRFVVPGTNPIAIAPTNWQSSKYGSYCWFMYAGSDFWVMLDGNGEWANDAGKTIAAYNWDGNIAGGTEGNTVDIDAYGNIHDSGVGAEIQVTCTDNATEDIDLGPVATYRAFFLEFTMEGPSATEAGRIMVMHHGGTAAENVDRTGVPSAISGVSFDSDIDSGTLRLNITLASVGDVVEFRYRMSRIELAS